MPTTIETATAELDVVTGRLQIRVRCRVDGEEIDFLPLHSGYDGATAAELEPWGEEEYDLDRADTALDDMGWARTADRDRSHQRGMETVAIHAQNVNWLGGPSADRDSAPSQGALSRIPAVCQSFDRANRRDPG